MVQGSGYEGFESDDIPLTFSLTLSTKRMNFWQQVTRCHFEMFFLIGSHIDKVRLKERTFTPVLAIRLETVSFPASSLTDLPKLSLAGGTYGVTCV